MAKYYLDLINASAKADPGTFVRQSSENYLMSVEKAADLLADKRKKIIMLAGPSSSGKTTTASLLEADLEERGISTHTVSLDDFYLVDYDQYPLNEDGSYDFESIAALDLSLIEKCFYELIVKGESNLPKFDFSKHLRIENANHIKLDDDCAIIVEGIHGLNPLITNCLPNEAMAKVYVNVSSRIHARDGSVILKKRDLRLIRRLVRDRNFRNTGADETLDNWDSVCRGEEKYIFPFRDHADIRLDTFHPCEIGLLAPEAKKLLKEAEDGEFGDWAENLRKSIELFTEIDKSNLSGDSLLYEFIKK